MGRDEPALPARVNSCDAVRDMVDLVTRRRAVSVAMALATMGLVACDDARPGPPCVDGTSRDPERAAALQRRLASQPLTRSLVAATEGRFVVCFGAGIESGLDAQHRVRLDASLGEDTAAAKLGHLLLHVSEGLPWDEDDARPCDARLATAREREGRAHALEASLLGAFGQPPPDDRALDRIMAGYRSRCPRGGKLP
jgi:hypothetical protein